MYLKSKISFKALVILGFLTFTTIGESSPLSSEIGDISKRSYKRIQTYKADASANFSKGAKGKDIYGSSDEALKVALKQAKAVAEAECKSDLLSNSKEEKEICFFNNDLTEKNTNYTSKTAKGETTYDSGSVEIRAVIWRVVKIEDPTLPIEGNGSCKYWSFPSLKAWTTESTVSVEKVEFASGEELLQSKAKDAIPIKKESGCRHWPDFTYCLSPAIYGTVGRDKLHSGLENRAIVKASIEGYDNCQKTDLVTSYDSARITCKKTIYTYHTELLPLTNLRTLSCNNIERCAQFYNNHKAPIREIENLNAASQRLNCAF